MRVNIFLLIFVVSSALLQELSFFEQPIERQLSDLGGWNRYANKRRRLARVKSITEAMKEPIQYAYLNQIQDFLNF